MKTLTNLYIVVCEQLYGGDSLIKVFTNKDRAIEYKNTLHGINTIIKEEKLYKQSNTVYVALTVGHYGGDSLKIFNTLEEAINHNTVQKALLDSDIKEEVSNMLKVFNNPTIPMNSELEGLDTLINALTDIVVAPLNESLVLDKVITCNIE